MPRRAPLPLTEEHDIRPLPNERNLNPRQIRFVTLYLTHGDGPEAYREAYGHKSKSREQLHVAAHVALNRPGVKEIVAAAKKAAAKRARKLVVEQQAKEPLVENYALSKDVIARNLARLAFSNMRDYVSWGPDGVIVKDSEELTEAQAYGVIEITQTMRADGGRTVKLKLADKRQSLMDLAKLMGLMEAEDAPPPAPDQERRQRVLRQLHGLMNELAKPEPLTIDAAD